MPANHHCYFLGYSGANRVPDGVKNRVTANLAVPILRRNLAESHRERDRLESLHRRPSCSLIKVSRFYMPVKKGLYSASDQDCTPRRHDPLEQDQGMNHLTVSTRSEGILGRNKSGRIPLGTGVRPFLLPIWCVPASKHLYGRNVESWDAILLQGRSGPNGSLDC